MRNNLEFFAFLDSIEPTKAKTVYSLLCPKTFSRNTILLSEGQICKEINIIKKGVAVKSFYHGERVVTSAICLVGDIALSYDSFTYQTPSSESIVAMTDLECLCLSFEKYLDAKKKYPWLIEYDRMLLDRYIVKLEYSVKELTTLNAAERYEKILLHYAKLLEEVPLKVIASYLNVSVERLSRIRAKIQTAC
jgi:CRP-like cAMP-binding protein